jgi:uncharacterized protein (TIGR02246 family)
MSHVRAGSYRDLVSGANRRFMDAFKRQHAADLAALYTTDGQLLPAHSDVVSGRPAIEKFWQAVMTAGIAEVLLETSEADGASDQAWEVGSYTLKSQDGTTADRGKYVVIWQRAGDTWQLHRDIWTTSLPA